MAIADRLREELAPILTPALATYCDAIAGMFSEVEQLALDTDTADGWTILLDVHRAPAKALPWLGQIVGVDVPIGTPEAAARQLILDRPRQRRGTVAAMVAAAQSTLTGTRNVIVRERDAAACPSLPAYGITMIARTSECPSPAATDAAIREQKPAGLVLDFHTLAGQDWQSVKSHNASWTAVKTAFGSWQAVRDTTP